MAGDEIFPLAGRRVWVAGHKGMVGSAVVRRLEREACRVLIAGRTELDLSRQAETERWVIENSPDAIVLAAAKVGGILANKAYPAEFIYANLVIETNVVHAARLAGVKKVLMLGSSCIYPKLAPQPITENALLTGPLEPTNEWYAIAKIAGIKLGQAYREQYGLDIVSAMPTNLYGPGDNFDLDTGHVLPALIRKAHEAKVARQAKLTIWGSGTPRREFLHADDCADALVFLLKNYSACEHVNVGSGEDITILELARLVADVVGFDGEVSRDLSKPDGTPRKLMSADKLQSMGWRSTRGLRDGIRDVYQWFIANRADGQA